MKRELWEEIRDIMKIEAEIFQNFNKENSK